MVKNKIKTMVATSKAEIDDLVNQFGEDNKVFATQTNVNIVGSSKVYTYVLFYREED